MDGIFSRVVKDGGGRFYVPHREGFFYERCLVAVMRVTDGREDGFVSAGKVVAKIGRSLLQSIFWSFSFRERRTGYNFPTDGAIDLTGIRKRGATDDLGELEAINEGGGVPAYIPRKKSISIAYTRIRVRKSEYQTLL